MSAERIAQAVSDLRAGRVRPLNWSPDAEWSDDDYRAALRFAMAATETVVDVSALEDSVNRQWGDLTGREIYKTFCLAPPWQRAVLGYTYRSLASAAPDLVIPPQLLNGCALVCITVFDLEEEELPDRWLITLSSWRYLGRYVAGPMANGVLRVREDGLLNECRLVRTVNPEPEPVDHQLLLTMAAFNFLNCRNVEIVEPRRPRGEARRITRCGVRVHTINVFPVGRASRSRGEASGLGTPLTSVRGHFAHYGEEYSRGLLFGKLSGRYWIPQHARGDAEHGFDFHDYELRP